MVSRTDHCLELKLSSSIILKTIFMLEFESGWNGPLDEEAEGRKNN